MKPMATVLQQPTEAPSLGTGPKSSGAFRSQSNMTRRFTLIGYRGNRNASSPNLPSEAQLRTSNANSSTDSEVKVFHPNKSSSNVTTELKHKKSRFSLMKRFGKVSDHTRQQLHRCSLEPRLTQYFCFHRAVTEGT